MLKKQTIYLLLLSSISILSKKQIKVNWHIKNEIFEDSGDVQIIIDEDERLGSFKKKVNDAIIPGNTQGTLLDEYILILKSSTPKSRSLHCLNLKMPFRMTGFSSYTELQAEYIPNDSSEVKSDSNQGSNSRNNSVVLYKFSNKKTNRHDKFQNSKLIVSNMLYE